MSDSSPAPSETPPSAGQAPPGYVVAYALRLSASTRVVLVLNLGAILLLIPAVALFVWPAVARGFLAIGPVFALTVTLVDGLLLIAAAIGIVVAHEAVHGLAMLGFGARPRFGIKWELMAAYAVASGHLFGRDAFLVVALTPLLTLTPVMWALAWWVPSGALWTALALAGVLNTVGAIGDLYMAWQVARHPASARVLDEEDGMTVFVQASGVGPQASA